MRVIFLLMLMVIASNDALAEDRKCLDGFELTAIVVLETDIRQSVEAFACRMAFPNDSSTYALYTRLRDKWKQPRGQQREMRDKVYQRIYGDAWQQKVDDWTQAMAVSYGKSFKPGDIACHDLRNEMGAHASDWERLYNSAAREAASARYDPLRCESPTEIMLVTPEGVNVEVQEADNSNLHMPGTSDVPKESKQEVPEDGSQEGGDSGHTPRILRIFYGDQ